MPLTLLQSLTVRCLANANCVPGTILVLWMVLAWTLFFAVFSRPGLAGDGTLVWKTIETEHFIIHYHEPLDDVAYKVAAAAERSHEVLVPVFDYAPPQKTQVVLTDNTDSSNGFAGVLPRNRIRLFTTAPTSLSSLNDHDDWMFTLVAHEYVHILHIDTIGGLADIVNKIVGKIWAPNQIQPRWLIEGIATYQESEQTSGGRIRNALFDMELRMDTLAGNKHQLDAMSSGPRAWPRGNVAYLYGSHFLKYVFDRHGADKLGEMSWAHGSSTLPYGINRAVLQATGEHFETHYDNWTQHLRDKYALQEEAATRLGLRQGRRLTFSAEINTAPQYSADGAALIWRHGDGYREGRFRTMPVGGNVGQASDYAFIERVGDFALLSDGSMVIEQNGTYRTNYSFQDIFLWDRRSDTVRAYTHGQRARSPAVSKDQGSLAFVVNDAGRTSLAVTPMQPMASPRIVWAGDDRYDQVADPTWAPDGKSIAISTWSRGGYRDIAVVDVDSGRASFITRDRALDVNPVFSPDGAYLYFVSDRSGIYNVYAYQLATAELWQVTNVLGGAFMPHVSPDGTRMAYQGFVGRGYDIFEIDLEPTRFVPALPYVDDRPEPADVDADVDAGTVLATAPRPYRAIETLAPRTYDVELLSNSFGDAINISTDGSDVAGLHSYSLGATVGLDRAGINMGASYGFSGWWPFLRAAVSRDSSRRGGLIIDGVNTAYTQDRYRLSTSGDVTLLSSDIGRARLGVSYDLDWFRIVDDVRGAPDPNQQLTRGPEDNVRFAALSLRWSYSNAQGNTYTIGGQSGNSLSASLRLDHPVLGSSVRAMSLFYRWDAFAKLPWADTASLSIGLAGGIRVTDQGNAGSFVLGGVPDQDVVQAIIESVRFSSSGYLRGYRPGTVIGSQYHLANIEYRQQLWEIERGLSSLPIYVRRMHVGGLVDVGNAFSDGFDPLDFRAAVGASMRLDVVFGYVVPGSFDIGYARGLVDDGVGEYWLLMTGTI